MCRDADRVGGFIIAKYIKLVLLQPDWLTNGWRQLVEFQLMTNRNIGVKPASELAEMAALSADSALEQNDPNPFRSRSRSSFRYPPLRRYPSKYTMQPVGKLRLWPMD